MLSPPPGLSVTRYGHASAAGHRGAGVGQTKLLTNEFGAISCGTNQGSGDFHVLPQIEVLGLHHHLLEDILLRLSHRLRGVLL